MNEVRGYLQHVAFLQDLYEQAIGGEFEGVLLHSGGEDCYFADDRVIPFQAYGHFGPPMGPDVGVNLTDR